ncbi:hypothetical protein V1477_018827 [Vespula maculifrons]|uniref:Uncharacterized protein n=1 Tax=Vespula maculifrons TaxID=7453 RepID=A0ABD2AWH1_VESMC
MKKRRRMRTKKRRRRRMRTEKKKNEEEKKKKEEEEEEEEECILVSPSTLVIDEMTPKWRTDGRDYRMFKIGCCGIQHPKPTGFPSTRSKPQRPPRLLARPSGERANASSKDNNELRDIFIRVEKYYDHDKWHPNPGLSISSRRRLVARGLYLPGISFLPWQDCVALAHTPPYTIALRHTLSPLGAIHIDQSVYYERRTAA